jgi:outer membrane protein assembly factor BamB
MSRRITTTAIVALALAAACNHAPPPALATAWSWSAPEPAYVGMPAAARGVVAATYGHSVLVALDARTGRPRWRASRIGLRDVAPTIDGDRILAATDNGVVALAEADGRVLWDRTLGERPSSPLVVDGAVVVTTWEGRLVALDRWALDLAGPSLGPPAAGLNVVVAAWDTGVVAVDAATGAVRWRHEFGSPGTSAPVVVAGLAVVVAGDGAAHAYDLVSGREHWSQPMHGAGSPEAPPAAAAGLVAIADRSGYLVVLDAASGRRRWNADGDAAVERGGPAFAGDAVALPLDDGRLLVASRHGRTLTNPEGRVSGVAAAGRLFVATREGTANGLTGLDVTPR